jgi:hypothetical protein
MMAYMKFFMFKKIFLSHGDGKKLRQVTKITFFCNFDVYLAFIRKTFYFILDSRFNLTTLTTPRVYVKYGSINFMFDNLLSFDEFFNIP